jgi:hypothetical protein
VDHDAIYDAYENGRPRPKLVSSAEPLKRPPLKLHPAKLPDPTKIPPRQWLYGTQLIRGYVTVLVAPGGTGKSAYAMGAVLALVANRNLLNEHVFSQVNGAVFNLEDPMEELERRLAALMIRHRVSKNDIEGHFFLDDGEERGLCLAKVDDNDGFTVIHPDEALLIEEITANKIGVLVCDPYAESHSLEENSNPQMVKAAAAWRRVARATGCAIMLVHHVRKGDATGIDAARGAKALTDSARVGLLLSTMAAAESESFGISEDERWQYVRLDDAKRNMAPAAKAKWFKLDQVSLGNYSKEYPNGDKVAAMVPWEPPTIWAGVTDQQINEALDIIATPPAGWLYSPTRQGRNNKRWAGQVLVDHLALNEKQAAAMIGVWLKSGLLYKETFQDEHRNERTGVRVDQTKRPG